jgi:hypothetical protein
MEIFESEKLEKHIFFFFQQATNLQLFNERMRFTIVIFYFHRCRVREIAYGFGGPSEKNVSPH